MLWILKYDNGYTKCIKPLQALYFLLKVWYNVISFSLGKPVRIPAWLAQGESASKNFKPAYHCGFCFDEYHNLFYTGYAG